ncbi:MAG: biopolymer transporter ExbD [Acidobacteria bacterium]|nr:biopolymer transporter ExbD [Acidobacteriota bacterium]
MVMSAASGNQPQGEINVTPLVDVVLVLLIIFMVVTPVLQMGIDVEIPPKVQLQAPPSEVQQDQLVISVRSDGMYLNRDRMQDLNVLRNTLASILASREQDKRVVFLNSEDEVTFQQTVAALDVAREAGAVKIGLLTDPPREISPSASPASPPSDQ